MVYYLVIVKASTLDYKVVISIFFMLYYYSLRNKSLYMLLKYNEPFISCVKNVLGF